MANAELPEFASATYTSSVVGMDAMGGVANAGQMHALGAIPGAPGVSRGTFVPVAPAILQQQRRRAENSLHYFNEAQAQMQQGVPMINRRLVQVFVADTNEQVPIKDCVLYSGEQQLTDLTDQELFYELSIKEMLDAHNAKRITMIDKTVKERTQYLEPARVRDLRMVVVTIAQF